MEFDWPLWYIQIFILNSKGWNDKDITDHHILKNCDVHLEALNFYDCCHDWWRLSTPNLSDLLKIAYTRVLIDWLIEYVYLGQMALLHLQFETVRWVDQALWKYLNKPLPKFNMIILDLYLIHLLGIGKGHRLFDCTVFTGWNLG